MPPFLQFRLWLRESPLSERVFSGIAAVVVLMLVVVALVPVATRDDDAPTALGATGAEPTLSTGAASGSDATGADTGTGATGATGATDDAPGASGGRAARSGGSSPAANGDAEAGATAESCGGLVASGPGIKANEVFIDVSTISLAGPIGNSQFDIRPDLHDIANALADEINKTGGLACGRKLRIKIYDVNPLDTNDAQAKCLQMVEDKPYLVVDFGGYLGQATRACFVQNKLPIISSVAFDAAEFKSAFPYVLSPRNLVEGQARNAILGLADRGFFAAPKFRKVGLLVENCIPSTVKLIDQLLAQVGLKANQISKFTLDCNPAAASNQIAQAVLQHKADDVSHVIFAAANNNAQNYTKIAASQGLRPLYGISDLGEGVTPSGAKNWDPSFDGGDRHHEHAYR